MTTEPRYSMRYDPGWGADFFDRGQPMATNDVLARLNEQEESLRNLEQLRGRVRVQAELIERLQAAANDRKAAPPPPEETPPPPPPAPLPPAAQLWGNP